MRSITALAVSLLCLSPSIAQNAVTNGSFERGLAGWYRNHDFPAAQHSEVVARPDRGKCLRLTSGRTSVDHAQNLEIEGGHTCVSRLDMKRSAPGDDIAAYAIVSRPNAKDAYYRLGSDATTLDRWQHLARTVRVPANTSRVRVLLLNRAEGGTAWFDDVQVVPVMDTSGPARGRCPKLGLSSAEAAPRIDGELSPGEWDSAGHITGFAQISDDSEPDANTEAWIAFDRTDLLLAVRCRALACDDLSEPVRADISWLASKLELGREFCALMADTYQALASRGRAGQMAEARGALAARLRREVSADLLDPIGGDIAAAVEIAGAMAEFCRREGPAA